MAQQDEIGNPSTIFVFGSTDAIVPCYAAALFFKTNPSSIICSGGIAHDGDLLDTGWDKSEAEIFKDIMVGFGVPEEIIHLEEHAKNTADNFELSYRLASDKKLDTSDILIIQKPYMTLRTKLTGLAKLEKVNFKVSSPKLSFTEYSKIVQDKEKLINIIVGDLQRIIEYPKFGFSKKCDIPYKVTESLTFLLDRGYIKHILTN
ncbi:MAG: YdcF family protein [Gammaproteobacteria bacterium]|nr:YdcF family protein [Gammaproteobacteria bacterium]